MVFEGDAGGHHGITDRGVAATASHGTQTLNYPGSRHVPIRCHVLLQSCRAVSPTTVECRVHTAI